MREAAATALMGLGDAESDAGVLEAITRALGSTGDPRAIPLLVRLAGHDDAGVRCQVACSLPSVWTEDPRAAEVLALISLTTDADPDVRNWATFALGTQLAAADTPEIRAALWARTTDDDADAREEGICGLARRRDRRAVPLIAELLGDEDGAHVLVFGAAAVLGAAELQPLLANFDAGDPGVTEALAECDPAVRDHRDQGAWALLCDLYRQHPDIRAALLSCRGDVGIHLDVAADGRLLTWSADTLLEHANGDPRQAATLVLAGLRHQGGPGVP